MKQARADHEAILAQVEKTRAKLAKRTRALQEIETRLAELEVERYDPDAAKLGQAAAGDKSLRPALLIYKPKENNGNDDQRLENIVSTLRAHGIRAQVGLKTSGKAARALAKEAVDDGIGLVIVAGGDGTIEEVASQLAGTNTTLGVVPSGTMNNVARSLGIPLEVDAACALIGMGVTRKIDMGHVLAHEKPDVEYFMETAGLGLSAIAFPAGQAAKKGKWAGLPSALRNLLGMKPSPIMVEMDDQPAVLGHTQLVTVSNAPMLGLNFMIAPDAKMDDGWLDVAIYDEMTKADVLGYFMKSTQGNPGPDPHIKRYRARRVRIRSDEPQPVVADKDGIPKRTNIEIEIMPDALTMIVGNGIGLSLPVQAVPMSVAEATPPVPGGQPEPTPVIVDAPEQEQTPVKSNGANG